MCESTELLVDYNKCYKTEGNTSFRQLVSSRLNHTNEKDYVFADRHILERLCKENRSVYENIGYRIQKCSNYQYKNYKSFFLRLNNVTNILEDLRFEMNDCMGNHRIIQSSRLLNCTKGLDDDYTYYKYFLKKN
jgi:hypothetical protein